MCNYCDRKYDCVNESRPGVASALLSPAQAERYLERVLAKNENLSVVGIAGPGDPFANPAETLETLRRVRTRWPHMLLCLASNGLEIPTYLDEIADIGVSHVTVTVNAVDADIATRIYSWARVGKVLYRGLDAARILLERQEVAIAGLKALGIVVKANTIVIPGINDQHVSAVAERMARLEGGFAQLHPGLPEQRHGVRTHLRTRGRAHGKNTDGGGRLFAADAPLQTLPRGRGGSFRRGTVQRISRKISPLAPAPSRVSTTVALMWPSPAAKEFSSTSIWAKRAASLFSVAARTSACISSSDGKRRPQAAGSCAGKDWPTYCTIAGLCWVHAAGATPKEALARLGLTVAEADGLIEHGLTAIYDGTPLSRPKGEGRGCSDGCATAKSGSVGRCGDGEGCG